MDVSLYFILYESSSRIPGLDREHNPATSHAKKRIKTFAIVRTPHSFTVLESDIFVVSHARKQES